MNKKDEKRREKINEILSKSFDLIYLNGYNGTSVNDIIQAAGISKGLFYNYFIDKEQYMIEALSYYNLVVNRKKNDMLQNKSINPLERISGFYNIAIEEMRKREYKCGCFLGNTAQELGDVNERISKEVQKITQSIIEKIYNNLIEAKQDGSLKSDIEPEILADFITSAWQGSLLKAKTAGDSKSLDNFIKVINKNLF